MNLQPQDIIIRKTDGAETLWLSQRLVIEVCGVDEEYTWLVRNRYKKSVRACDLAKSKEFMPDSGKAWRWAKTSNGFYYCIDNIPDRAPKFYRSMFGNVEDLKEALKGFENRSKKAFEVEVKREIERGVKRYYHNEDMRYYMLNASHLFAQEQAKELAMAKAWCLYMLSQLEKDSFKKLGIRRKQDFYALCTEILQPLNLKGLNISSAAYLRNKLDRYPMGSDENTQREWFISDNYGNEHRRIVGKCKVYDEETGEIFDFDPHEALMYSGYMNIGSSIKQYMSRIYKEYYLPGIAEFGLEPIAERTFTYNLRRFEKKLLMEKARHGEDYYKKHYLTYVVQEKLKYAHSLFSADGTGTITYRYWGTNNKGKREMKFLRLYVIMVIDVMSNYIAGYAFAPEGSHKETFGMLKTATQMAVTSGGDQTMFEFVSDNHGVFTSSQSEDYLGLVYEKVRTIERGNSQANPSEAHFRIFKKELKTLVSYLQSSYNPSIEGVANTEGFDKWNLPTYDEAVALIERKIYEWNNKELGDGSLRSERFENKHPQCQPMSKRLLRRIKGYRTEKSARYLRGFLILTKGTGANEVQYKFEIPDYEGVGLEMISKAVKHQLDKKMIIYYDETGADIYSPNEVFVLTCPRITGAHKAEIEATRESMAALSYQMDRKVRQIEAVEAFEDKVFQQSEAMGIQPYSVAMALGSNKEKYNGALESYSSLQRRDRESEVAEPKKMSAEALKRARARRDHDPTNWG